VWLSLADGQGEKVGGSQETAVMVSLWQNILITTI